MREQDRDRQKAEWEMKERMASEAMQRNEIQMKQSVEKMQNNIKRTDDELHRRQQENNVFMQVCVVEMRRIAQTPKQVRCF